MAQVTDSDLQELKDLINQSIAESKQQFKELDQKIEALEQDIKKWNDRFFQLVKEQGQTARTIIIAAASVIVFSSVLGAVSKLLRTTVLP